MFRFKISIVTFLSFFAITSGHTCNECNICPQPSKPSATRKTSVTTIASKNVIAFQNLRNVPQTTSLSSLKLKHANNILSPSSNPRALQNPFVANRKTILSMSYLPPSGNNNNNPLSDILPGITTVALTILFFMSPLGSIFFAITNSLFLLALITPVLLYTGFQIWLKFNTIEGSCPNCDYSPLVVTKSLSTSLDGGASPTICLNCGAFVRASEDNKSLELCNSGNPTGTANLDDGLFGRDWDFFGDVFGNDANINEDIITNRVNNGGGSNKSNDAKTKQMMREKTVIDIDILDD